MARTVSLATVLRAVWVAGVAVFLAPVVSAFIRLRRVRVNGLPWLEIRPLVRRLATQAGVTRPVDMTVNGKLKYRGEVVTSGRKRAFEVRDFITEP